MSEPRTLREALDRTAAAIDDPARFIEVNEHYRAGWVDGLRAVRDDPAVLALAAQSESAGPLDVERLVASFVPEATYHGSEVIGRIRAARLTAEKP